MNPRGNKTTKLGIVAIFRQLIMTNFVGANTMNAPRDFTPMEQAVTDLVNKSIGSDKVVGMAQLDRLEQFIDNIMTVRELLTSAKNQVLVNSSRLEMINEAFDLTESTIKELGVELLTESLKQLRTECAEEFLKVAEEAAVIT